ncbi:hypothetical protein C8T65DRAFT_71483 [Cerioporus squamosus]|nr:hypothetical protein C8T65DRAFT_71483 [Cerioporus squamosus]
MLELRSVSELPLPWTGSTPAVLRFVTIYPDYSFVLSLGRCTMSAPQPELVEKGEDEGPSRSDTDVPSAHVPVLAWAPRALALGMGRGGRMKTSKQRVEKPVSALRLGPHWATVHFLGDPFPSDTSGDSGFAPSGTSLAHDCAQDHIRDWPGGSRTFEHATDEISIPYISEPLPEPFEYTRTVSLSFGPCPLNPDNTYLVNIDRVAVF